MEGIGCEHVKNIHENSHVRKTTAPAIALIPKMGWEIRPKISLCSSSRLSNQTYRMRARWNMIAGRLMRLPQALLDASPRRPQSNHIPGQNEVHRFACVSSHLGMRIENGASI
jgi:hypothetical protein